MKTFADNDFLLHSETAKTLYHDHAAKMPIIDYHCHLDPKQIAEDRRFSNLTEVWLGGDHYKWRLIRANGEDEKLITGHESSDYEKFLAFARALPKAVGNPVYHWAHLELKRYFDCELTLSPQTAEEIWNHCNEKLQNPDMSARSLITRSRVDVIATTDDPLDSLAWHKAIAADLSFSTKVLPTMRPDKAINIDKPGFIDYVNELSKVTGIPIKSIDDLYAALAERIDFFNDSGCVISDHGLDYIPFAENAAENAPAIFMKAMHGTDISPLEAEQYKTALLLFFGCEYTVRNWAMQLHYGAIRNLNAPMHEKLGPDTGFDAINNIQSGSKIASLLGLLAKHDILPKTVLYSLNPCDDAMLQTIAGCFSASGIAGKVQHGSAWWFNDTKQGMEAQLTNLASRNLLGTFIGMLTDSRSFLSYPRHEYFRRILCNLIGNQVEQGEYPCDMEMLGGIVRDISYNNAMRYFGFMKY